MGSQLCLLFFIECFGLHLCSPSLCRGWALVSRQTLSKLLGLTSFGFCSQRQLFLFFNIQGLENHCCMCFICCCCCCFSGPYYSLFPRNGISFVFLNLVSGTASYLFAVFRNLGITFGPSFYLILRIRLSSPTESALSNLPLGHCVDSGSRSLLSCQFGQLSGPSVLLRTTCSGVSKTKMCSDLSPLQILQ